MAGDEVVADWLGDVWSDVITTTTAPQRFKSVSLRFRTVRLFVMHGTYHVYIGKYHPTTSVFIAGAVLAKAYESTKLEYVDLHELGCSTYAADVSVRILGINEY
jgi:hypothetical protein